MSPTTWDSNTLVCYITIRHKLTRKQFYLLANEFSLPPAAYTGYFNSSLYAFCFSMRTDISEIVDQERKAAFYYQMIAMYLNQTQQDFLCQIL